MGSMDVSVVQHVSLPKQPLCNAEETTEGVWHRVTYSSSIQHNDRDDTNHNPIALQEKQNPAKLN